MAMAPSETLQRLGWKKTKGLDTEYGSTAGLILLSKILVGQNQVWDLSGQDGGLLCRTRLHGSGYEDSRLSVIVVDGKFYRDNRSAKFHLRSEEHTSELQSR